MKVMTKYLLLFALFFGTLSFTDIAFSYSMETTSLDNTYIDMVSDSTLPPEVKNGLAKPAVHPVLPKENTIRKLKASPTPPVAPETSESAALVSVNAVAVCKGNGYFAGGRPRFVSGVFRDTLTSISGRDSIIVTELSILPCTLSE